jgi:hypothetical protein
MFRSGVFCLERRKLLTATLLLCLQLQADFVKFGNPTNRCDRVNQSFAFLPPCCVGCLGLDGSNEKLLPGWVGGGARCALAEHAG